MYLAEHLPKIDPSFEFEILGTDVDLESVKLAKNGVYRWDEIKESPAIYLKDFWKRGKSEIADFVRAGDNLRKFCKWEVQNLVDPDLGQGRGNFDLIFCRNVFIYFTPEQVKQITQKLLNVLSPAGFLFVGLSESLLNLGLSVDYAGPSIYQRQGVKEKSDLAVAKPVIETSKPHSKPLQQPQTLKVFCVDDSGTVLTLLKKVLQPSSGFEVVGTAKNGREAQEKVAAGLKFDVMTLDLQMPEVSGLEYLRSIQAEKHAPIVVVSSMSREDSQGGVAALALGARDFVEKPTLSNLDQKSEEIRFKLKSAFQNRNHKVKPVQNPLRSKGYKVDPKQSLRIVLASVGDREKAVLLAKSLESSDAPTLLFFEGTEDLAHSQLSDLQRVCPHPVSLLKDQTNFANSGLWISALDLTKFQSILSQSSDKKLSVCVMAGVSNKWEASIPKARSGVQFVIEDVEGGLGPEFLISSLGSLADHQVPVTSFVYHSIEFLGVLEK